jgi:ABC-type transporter Mla subunit MlaD
MPMDLGSIYAKISINIQEFTDGLKQALTQSQDFQKAFAQANATAAASTQQASAQVRGLAQQSSAAATTLTQGFQRSREALPSGVGGVRARARPCSCLTLLGLHRMFEHQAEAI